MFHVISCLILLEDERQVESMKIQRAVVVRKITNYHLQEWKTLPSI